MNGDPEAPYWCPGESDFTLRWNRSFQGGWFWGEGQDSMMFTVDELMTNTRQVLVEIQICCLELLLINEA